MSVALDPTTLKQIGDAIEAAGGDLDDARVLAHTYGEMQAQLQQANKLYGEGREQEAETLYTALETTFARPLADLAAEVIAERREGTEAQ